VDKLCRSALQLELNSAKIRLDAWHMLFYLSALSCRFGAYKSAMMHAPTSPRHATSPLLVVLIHFIFHHNSFAFSNRRGKTNSIPSTFTANCICQCIPPRPTVHYLLVRTDQVVKDLRARKVEGAIVPRLLECLTH